ncbi:CehA/McbA family metallohydrolase [Botrimarina sp.]|uniref:CehA/McbA family metallohydrolase n=1 Tax=Botrimarina sp. TaxID=2795802 RepID=UPI0032EF3323
MKRAAPTLAVAAFCLLASFADAHQSLSLDVPTAELGDAPPPLRGSTEFFAEALPLLRPRCDERAAELLDRVRQLLMDAQRVRWGAAPGADPRLADHLRAKAEATLVDLLERMPGVIVIDLDRAPQNLSRVAVDPQHNTLLLRVTSGRDGPTELRVIDWDLTGEAFDRSTELVAPDAGEACVVVRLAGVPEDPTTIRFAVRRRSQTDPTLWNAIELTTPPWSRLRLTLRDERNAPTHALVAIRSAAGGAYREPAGAVDLRAQLNDVVGPPVSEPGRGYMFFLPGEKRGRYWITPPETDMTLPAGQWEIVAMRGPEHTPVRQLVDLRPEQTVDVELSPRRWTRQSDEGWWSGDDHVHARLMSGADAQRLLDYAVAVDLGVANVLEMGDALRTYYPQRGFGPEFRARRGDHWLVPGQEDPRSDLGHAIGLNLRGKVRDLKHYLQNDRLAEAIHADGGLYGHTHVGANACFVHREMALFTPLEIVDFNSIMQADLGLELYYDFLNLGFKMTASAGADTPYGGTVGATRVYAHTGDPTELNPDAWFDALRAGKTFVTNGPMLRLRVAGAGPGETVAANEGEPLNVEVQAAGDPGWSAPERLDLVWRGKKVASAESPDASRESLRIRTAIDCDGGGWLAAHAIGHDGSEAHTTPVYVAGRDGFHGDREAVGALAQRQLKVLDEVEQMLQDAERLAAAPVSPQNLIAKVTAAQAEEVRQRVASARRFYTELSRRFEEATPASSAAAGRAAEP